MAEVKWIKLSIDMFDNSKIKFIRSLPEGNDILLTWIMLLTRAGRCNAKGYIFLTENIPYTQEMLSNEFNIPLNTIKLAIETLQRLNMIQNDDLGLCITGWEEHQNADGLDKIREQTKLRVQKHREKQRLLGECNVTGNDTVTQGNAIEEDKEIEKEYINEQVASLWNMYPKKKGKKTAESKIPKLIKQYGYEQIKRTVERYIDEVQVKGIEMQYIKQGDTFFNSGYFDYLDENYKQDIVIDMQKQRKPREIKFV